MPPGRGVAAPAGRGAAAPVGRGEAPAGRGMGAPAGRGGPVAGGRGPAGGGRGGAGAPKGPQPTKPVIKTAVKLKGIFWKRLILDPEKPVEIVWKYVKEGPIN